MPTRPLRASRRLLLGTLLLAAIVPVTARAADSPVSTTPVVDGPVNATLFDSSGRAYVGGSFNYVGPRLGSGVALTAGSATPAAGVPDINGSVLTAVPDGAGGQFIGGRFTSVGGVPRNRLAHLRADHSLDPGWNPDANGVVRTLARSTSGDTIFVGGDFTNIGGASRSRLAELPSSGTGQATAWNPSVDNGSVHVLLVSPSAVYVGGSFNSIGGNVTGPRLARVAPTGDGAPDATWVPAPVGAGVEALALSGTDLFVGGSFFQIGGQNRSNLAKVSTGGTGTADGTWDPSPFNPVNALLVSGPDVFVGGSFSGPIGGKPRSGLAKLSTTGTGAADATWDPEALGVVDTLATSGSDLLVGGFFQQIDGVSRNNLAAVSPTGTGGATSWDPNANGEVHTLATSGTAIFAGGDFSSAGPLNEFRGGLIRLNADGSLDKTWDPRVTGPVQALALDGTDLFAGGFFNHVKGQPRVALAKIPTAGTGAPDANWNPGASNPVRALAVSGGSIFVGGEFFGPASIGGATRDEIAKLSTSGTGTVDPNWHPDAQGGPVNALAISGSDLFVGGSFFQIGGQGRNRLAKLSTDGTGTVDPTWDPSATNTVNALLPSGSSIFVGGAFGTIGGRTRSRLAKLSTTGAGNADASWSPAPGNAVFSLALSGDNLYVGGVFSTVNGESRSQGARVSATTGALDAGFKPLASTSGGGWNAVAASQSRVLAGGVFANIGPLSTSDVALFDLTSPTLALMVPADGARYRQGNVINASYTCADEDAAADSISCTGTAASGSPIDTATAGAKSFTATAADVGGNSASSTVHYTVDGSAPEISIAIPAEGASFVVGTRVNVTFTCIDEDGAADVASCTGTSPTGSVLDTSRVGTRSFTVTSADAVGNTSTKQVSYEVTGVAPVLSGLKIAPKKFKAKKGAKVSFILSEANPVTFKVTRKAGTKTVTVGSFKRAGKIGSNSFKFRGRARNTKGKRLTPGAYRLSAQASAPSGLNSRALSKPFRILKP